MTRFIISLIFSLIYFTSVAQEIDLLILNNENDKALELINNELSKDSVQPKLYLKKGLILQKKFDYPGAIEVLEKGYSFDSLNVNILNELADCHTTLGNYKQALPYCKALYQTDTTSLIYSIKLARAFFNTRNYQEPFAILGAAYHHDTTNLMVNKLFALSASRSGHDSIAIALYQQVIAQNPTDLNNYNNLAGIYQKKDNYPKVIETLENGLKAFPEESTLLLKLGDAHFGKRSYSKAINPYEVYLSFGDSTVDILKNLGICYYYEKCTDEGLYLLEKCLTLKPNDPITALFTGLCYKDQKEIKTSIDYINFAAKTALPYYLSDIYNQLGILYGLKREFKKSVEALKYSYSLDTTRCEILFKIATTYEEFQKDKTQALKYYNEFLKYARKENDYQNELIAYALERKKKIREYLAKQKK